MVFEKNTSTSGTISPFDGFDPVSYFDRKPPEGKSETKFSYNAVTYQLASQPNPEKFKANPWKFEPASGGWCAYVMGEHGKK